MTANTLEQHILSIVCSVFDAYSAVLFLPSENGEEHYLAASFSLGEGVEQGAMLSSGSLVDWIIRNRQQMLVPNFDQHKHKLGYYREGEEAGIKAFMGCPVPTGGALCVDSKRQYSFTDRDYKLLQLFAELVSRQQASLSLIHICSGFRHLPARSPAHHHGFPLDGAGAPLLSSPPFQPLQRDGRERQRIS